MSILDDLNAKHEAGECCGACKEQVQTAHADMKRFGAAEQWLLPAHCKGKEGDVVVVEIVMDRRFRADTMKAVDLTEDKYSGTEVIELVFGGKSQLPPETAWSTAAFQNHLGCGIAFPTVAKGDVIRIGVRFLKTTEWYAAFSGLALPPELES